MLLAVPIIVEIVLDQLVFLGVLDMLSYSALHMKLQWADFFLCLFRTNVRLSW